MFQGLLSRCLIKSDTSKVVAVVTYMSFVSSLFVVVSCSSGFNLDQFVNDHKPNFVGCWSSQISTTNILNSGIWNKPRILLLVCVILKCVLKRCMYKPCTNCTSNIRSTWSINTSTVPIVTRMIESINQSTTSTTTTTCIFCTDRKDLIEGSMANWRRS